MTRNLGAQRAASDHSGARAKAGYQEQQRQIEATGNRSGLRETPARADLSQASEAAAARLDNLGEAAVQKARLQSCISMRERRRVIIGVPVQPVGGSRRYELLDGS